MPHIAVLSTGDELAEPGTPHLPPGAIRDANRPMLLVLSCHHVCHLCHSFQTFLGTPSCRAAT